MLKVDGITKDFVPPLSVGRIARLDFKRPPAVHALKDVSFDLVKGSILAILGPNGAGKTTLLKILSTLTIPDSGTVMLNGLRIGSNDNKIRALVGLAASSERGFYPRLTGRQNLEFFAALYGFSGENAKSRTEELYKLFGVDYQNKRFDSYSAGMQQNFSLMRALLHEPDLLLLDEPTRSLDYAASMALRDLIKKRLVKERSKTVIFTTHHMDEAADFAEVFMILHKGRVYAFGSLAQLRSASGMPGAGLGEIFIKLTARA
jgi:ABC-type multidrug transport system ATPase subunit